MAANAFPWSRSRSTLDSQASCKTPAVCEDQLADLRVSLASDGEPLVFADDATSGTVWDRPGLQALLRAVESRVASVRSGWSTRPALA